MAGTWRTSMRWPWSSLPHPRPSDAVRKKVAALYPPQEVEQFTELFVGRIRRWTELEGRG